MVDQQTIPTIQGYLKISGKLEVLTGLHIGGGKDNSAIGVVDNTIIRDPLTRQPIIPGSSLKGKIRTLLARTENDNNFLGEHKDDSDSILKLFGSSEKNKIILARLIFSDCRLNEDSFKQLKDANTDLYLSEVKFENTIDRKDAQAVPRQLERVPAGAIFDFELTYIIEKALTQEQIEADLKLIKKGLRLLEFDYLGGSGTRGSGRVKFDDKLQSKLESVSNGNLVITQENINQILN